MTQDRFTPVAMFTRARSPLNDAYKALGDVGDELRSDWPGYVLSDDQADARTAVYAEIDAAKAAINRAQDALTRAIDAGNHRERGRG